MAVGVSIGDALQALRGSEYVVAQGSDFCKYSFSRSYVVVNMYTLGNRSNKTKIQLGAQRELSLRGTIVASDDFNSLIITFANSLGPY